MKWFKFTEFFFNILEKLIQLFWLLQFFSGRDLTYERALQIVQNEEYLVAVDADLIRRRSDLGFG